MEKAAKRYTLTITCPDKKGVVSAATTFLASHDAFIVEANHHTDLPTGQAFLRIVFQADSPAMPGLAQLRADFAAVADDYQMDWDLTRNDRRMRVLIAVSKFGHCLHNLLHRWKSGILPVEIIGVVSNHEDMRSFVEWHGLPYHHLPISRETKRAQEKDIMKIIDDQKVDLYVLARYMQVLSPEMCRALEGRAINIHHSFLPSFKGAKPYHQAYDRGVKIIGATAHYVTTNLDEGPIIEQSVERVDHSVSPEELVNIGRDIECVVLSRAVKWHAERRILLAGHRTVVFK